MVDAASRILLPAAQVQDRRVGGSAHDRAALKFHDVGIEIVKNDEGAVGYRVYAGGGMGRTPYIGHVVGEFVEKQDILAFLEAVMRVYNQSGRRDNIYKARIKILVNALGAEEMRRQVMREFDEIKATGSLDLPAEEVARIARYFAPPLSKLQATTCRNTKPRVRQMRRSAPGPKTNLARHRAPGYAIATISLKPIGGVPGDATHEQLDALADLLDAFGMGELRVSHEQNLVLPHVRKKDLPAIFAQLAALGLATPNAGLVTDIIACPGLDYCDLANARSIPIAQSISERFADLDRQHDIGELKIKISGCINACGHHHAGHIGVLGVDKKGVEYLPAAARRLRRGRREHRRDPGAGLRRTRDRRCGRTRRRRLSRTPREQRTLPRHGSSSRHRTL